MFLLPSSALDIPGFYYLDSFLDVSLETLCIGAFDRYGWDRPGGALPAVQSAGYAYESATGEVLPSVLRPRLPDPVDVVAHRLRSSFPLAFDAVPNAMRVVEYTRGQYVLPHVDTLCFGRSIAIISLLASWTMSFAPVAHSSPDFSLSFPLARRSLLLLTGDARSLWSHGIPPVENNGSAVGFRRISLSLRLVPRPFSYTDV